MPRSVRRKASERSDNTRAVPLKIPNLSLSLSLSLSLLLVCFESLQCTRLLCCSTPFGGSSFDVPRTPFLPLSLSALRCSVKTALRMRSISPHDISAYSLPTPDLTEIHLDDLASLSTYPNSYPHHILSQAARISSYLAGFRRAPAWGAVRFPRELLESASTQSRRAFLCTRSESEILSGTARSQERSRNQKRAE